MENQFRQALLDRAPTFGAWMQIGHPACAEILGRLGFDWVCVDLEHGAIDLETMTNLFRTLDAFGCVPVARLPWNDRIWIRRTLDAGARGLIVPMVNSAAEAGLAVREAKYPPRGVRGFGYSRANLHGIDFQSSLSAANDAIALVMQIEHKDAIAGIDEILTVPDVDALFIGPLDLSGSFGKVGDLTCQEMTAALARFRDACRRHGKTAGMHVLQPTPEAVRKALDEGYTMIALGVDCAMLSGAAAAALRAAGRCPRR